MSNFTAYTQHRSDRIRGTTAKDILNAIRDGSWRSQPCEPQYIAAPVPSRARASYTDILDNEWELWRGGVRLVSTKQEAVQREYLVERLQDQDQDDAAEVARLLDELLELQRRRRAQEKERLLAHAWSVPFRVPRAFDRAEPGLFDETTATTRSVWGSAGNVHYDATESPATSSSRPLSFSTSSTTDTSAMLPSVEHMVIPAVGAFSDYSQGRVNAGAYEADPELLSYTDSIVPPKSSSMSSLPKILARGFSFFEAAPMKVTGKVSWGTRVGRRIRDCGRQIMGQA